MAVASISPGSVPLNSHGAGGTTGRRLLITSTGPPTPALAPALAPAFAPALAPATPPHAPYPPVTVVLPPPRRGRSAHNLGTSSPSTTTSDTTTL
eukprot:scaffold137626_cov98-Attheya_sp.AAC.1